MSPKDFQKMSLPDPELFTKRVNGNAQTDRHTRFLELFGTSVGTTQECLQKI